MARDGDDRLRRCDRAGEAPRRAGRAPGGDQHRRDGDVWLRGSVPCDAYAATAESSQLAGDAADSDVYDRAVPHLAIPDRRGHGPDRRRRPAAAEAAARLPRAGVDLGGRGGERGGGARDDRARGAGARAARRAAARHGRLRGAAAARHGRRARAGHARHLARGRGRPARRLPARRRRLRREAGVAEGARGQGEGVHEPHRRGRGAAAADGVRAARDRARRAPRARRRRRGAAHAARVRPARRARRAPRLGLLARPPAARGLGHRRRARSRRGSSTSTSRTSAASSPRPAPTASCTRFAASATGSRSPAAETSS